MDTVLYVCPKCGLRTRQRADAQEVVHVCPKTRPTRYVRLVQESRVG